MATRLIESNRKKVKYGTRKALLESGVKRYFTGLPCKYGHIAERQTTNGKCVVCMQAYADSNRDKRRAAVRKCEAKDIPAKNARIRQWRLDNPDKNCLKSNRRRVSKLKRTPAWLTPDDHWMMEQAYELAALRTKMFGFVWHVDHILPLQGRLVSGLHVPLNLQVIPGTENLRKNNQHEVQ